MLRSLAKTLALTLGVALLPGAAGAADIAVQKMDIVTPASSNVPYDGKYAAAFPGGFPIGIGSGLCYVGVAKDGARVFYAISDRGPNADSPKLAQDGGKPKDTKMFPSPKFAPSYGAIRVKDGKAELASLLTLKDGHGADITGLPVPGGLVGSTGETALSDTLSVLSFDKRGLDTEGIDLDRKDPRYMWICDEYGPFIAKVEANTGRIVAKYAPGKGLPEVLAKRQANRGFEGLAVTPSNQVVAVVQSICDVDGKVKDSKASFLRMVRLDPATGKTEMFAYPIDVDAYKKTADAKIGDLHAVSDTKFLIVEQAKGKDGNMRNLIYLVDTTDASDMSGVMAADGRELETLGSRAEVEARGVRYATKKLVADLRALGWTAEKAEGLALLPDGRTLAVCSDNDFGMAAKIVNPAKDAEGKDVKKPTAYVTDGKGGVSYDGKAVDTAFELAPSGEAASFWLLTLPEPIR